MEEVRPDEGEIDILARNAPPPPTLVPGSPHNTVGACRGPRMAAILA